MDIDIVDLEGLNQEELPYDDHINADLIVKRFKDEEVDAVFFPHCNFGTEDTVARVGKVLDKPVLLWGPCDEAPLADGMRLPLRHLSSHEYAHLNKISGNHLQHTLSHQAYPPHLNQQVCYDI